MIAADTSSLVAYFSGEKGNDVDAVAAAMADSLLHLPCVVVTELLSYPKAGPDLETVVASLPTLDPTSGYWVRAGETRRRVLSHGFKARIADALIAQSCIDYKVALISRDGDFRHFAKHCRLMLA